jgi:hypothetical protein
MTNYNPEVERQLNALADLCCQALEGESESLADRSEPLLRALLLSGFTRSAEAPLQVEVEKRIRDRCREPAIHRGGAISGLTRQLQSSFDELARWESKSPSETNPPQAANVGSAATARSRKSSRK